MVCANLRHAGVRQKVRQKGEPVWCPQFLHAFPPHSLEPHTEQLNTHAKKNTRQSKAFAQQTHMPLSRPRVCGLSKASEGKTSLRPAELMIHRCWRRVVQQPHNRLQQSEEKDANTATSVYSRSGTLHVSSPHTYTHPSQSQATDLDTAVVSPGVTRAERAWLP